MFRVNFYVPVNKETHKGSTLKMENTECRPPFSQIKKTQVLSHKEKNLRNEKNKLWVIIVALQCLHHAVSRLSFVKIENLTLINAQKFFKQKQARNQQNWFYILKKTSKACKASSAYSWEIQTVFPGFEYWFGTPINRLIQSTHLHNVQNILICTENFSLKVTWKELRDDPKTRVMDISDLMTQ